MSVLTARLDKLAPALTAKERAILMLRRHTAGLEPDPELLRSMPKEQAREYDRYAGLAYVANAHLGSLLRVIHMQVDSLEFHRDQLANLDEAAGRLESELPDEVQANPVRGWRKREKVSVPEFLRGLALEMRTNLQEALVLRWQELRALEIVWNEIAAEFDGEDTLHPELRREANDTGAKIKALAGKKAKSLPGPEDPMVTDTRELVDQAFEALGLIRRDQ